MNEFKPVLADPMCDICKHKYFKKTTKCDIDKEG